MYAQPLLQAQSPHAFLQTKSLILVLIPSHLIKLLKTSILKHHLKLTSDAVHHRLIRDLVAVVPSRLREFILQMCIRDSSYIILQISNQGRLMSAVGH